MSLLDEIAAARVHVGASCAVAVVLASLPAADADDLRAAISDRVRYGNAQIARGLRGRDIRINDSSISRHRSGDCKCPPS